MAVKIIIHRKVPKGKESQLLPLLIDLRSKATTQPGYISGETLRNVNDPQDCVVISTWQSAEAWKAWEASQGRAEIQAKIDALLGEHVQDILLWLMVHSARGGVHRAMSKARRAEAQGDEVVPGWSYTTLDPP
jgi:heme-degrading monooxygenase HmoA